MMRLTQTFLGALGLAVVLPAIAQEQEPPAQADVQTIDEVLVTARKKQETLQEVPVAVTAFTAQNIQDRQIRSIEDIARFTPGFVFSKAFGRATERPVVRGQSSILAGTNVSAEAGAAYFVDGVYYPGDIQSLDMNDVERVEVIKGPQSALYGRNTYSGAINFVTRGPGEEFGVRLAGHFDEDEYEANLGLGGPITETLGARINLRKMEFDGQWQNTVTGDTIGSESTDSVSLVVDFRPSEQLSFRLRGSYNEDRDGTRPLFLQSAALNNCMPGVRSLASYPASGSTNRNQYFCGDILAQPIALNDGPRQTLNALPGVPTNVTIFGASAYNAAQGVAFSGVNRDLTLASLIGNWDIGSSGYSLTAQGAWRDEERKSGSDSDHSSVNYIPAAAPGIQGTCFLCASDLDLYKDWSGEVRLSSPQDKQVRWSVGAFHYEQDQETRTVTFEFDEGLPAATTPCPAGPNAGRTCSGSPYRFLDVYTDAYFGSAEVDITDKFTVTGELRYEEDAKGFADLAPVTPASPVTYDKKSFSNTIPRVTLRYRPRSDLNVYAIYAEGIKPGGSNGRTGAQVGSPEFQQEQSKNYEFGAKTQWADGRVTANVAGYFTDVSQVQLTTPVAITTGTANSTLTSIVSNQGSGEIRGAELELQWLMTDNVTFGFNYALTDSQFTEGCDGDQFLLTSGGGPYNPLFSDDAQPNNLNGQGSCSIKGKQFPLTSKNTASGTLDFKYPLQRANWLMYANLDVTYESRKPVQVHNLAYIPSATVTGLRAGLRTENWSAGLYVRNLFDEDAPVAVTRWLQAPYFVSPAVVQPNGPPPAPIVPPACSATTPSPCGSYTLPRSFFGALRRERQLGLEFTYSFGGSD